MPPPHTSPLFRLLTPLFHFQSFRPTHNASSHLPNHTSLFKSSSTRTFTTTSPQHAGPPSRGGRNPNANKNRSTKDQRIALIRYHLQHPKTPRPLRLSRMRALRHWTIHRAWMLFRRKRLEREERELYRMYQAQQSAVEELRTMDPVGNKDSGRLYRIAMEKRGVFGHGGVPIEYARWQVDTPGKEAWNHGWTRN